MTHNPCKHNKERPPWPLVQLPSLGLPASPLWERTFAFIAIKLLFTWEFGSKFFLGPTQKQRQGVGAGGEADGTHHWHTEIKSIYISGEGTFVLLCKYTLYNFTRMLNQSLLNETHQRKTYINTWTNLDKVHNSSIWQLTLLHVK